MKILTVLYRYSSVILFLILSFNHTNGQSPKPKGEHITITQVRLEDKTLEDSIYAFIKNESENDSLFNKSGYILLLFDHYNYTNPTKKIIYSCFYNKSYDAFDDINDDAAFPLFYTYINNRIVIIKDLPVASSINYSITKKSKRKFIKRLTPFLTKASTITIKGQKVKNFRFPIVVIHGGKRFFKLSDGSVFTENEKY